MKLKSLLKKLQLSFIFHYISRYKIKESKITKKRCMESVRQKKYVEIGLHNKSHDSWQHAWGRDSYAATARFGNSTQAFSRYFPRRYR